MFFDLGYVVFRFIVEQLKNLFEKPAGLCYKRTEVMQLTSTVLETERLRIHVASLAEMKTFLERQTDDELIAAYQEMLQGCLCHPEQWVWYAIWMIELKNGTYVGDLSFKGLQPDGSVEIGYGLLKEHHGNGYATESVRAAVNWALGQPGVTRVEAETEPDNRASQRVLEKCGFIPSGQNGKEGPRFVRLR